MTGGLMDYPPIPKKRPSLLIEAAGQYPFLRGMDIGYETNPREGAGYLEYWPKDEPGNDSFPRPASFPLNKSGIEVYRKDTRPIDIAADVVSHELVNTDPVIKSYYERFQGSMTDDQKSRLNDQYSHAQSEGEQRPFDQWKSSSGLPAYFRGYAFDQWPKDEASTLYTPEQRVMFDQMVKYLKGGAQ